MVTPCSKGREPHVAALGGRGPVCKGHKTEARGGDCCRKRALAGQDVCFHHGGNAPQNRRAGAARVLTRAITAEANALLASEGLEGVEDPIGELGKLAQEARAWKLALAARVNALDAIRYTGGLERDEDGDLRGTGTEQTRAEVPLYERAMDRQARLLEVLVKHAGMGNVDQTKAMLTRIGEEFGISP